MSKTTREQYLVLSNIIPSRSPAPTRATSISICFFGAFRRAEMSEGGREERFPRGEDGIVGENTAVDGLFGMKGPSSSTGSGSSDTISDTTHSPVRENEKELV
jgi:hypothetical protein